MIHKDDAEFSTETLQILAEELEQKLLKNAVYRDFVRVQRLLAERRGGPAKVDLGRPPATSITPTPYRGVTVRLGRITAIGAATKALKEAGRPMNIHELAEAVQRLGFEFTGKAKSPASALPVYLRKPKDKSPIVSIWVDNKPMWWFRDQPVPGAIVA